MEVSAVDTPAWARRSSAASALRRKAMLDLRHCSSSPSTISRCTSAFACVMDGPNEILICYRINLCSAVIARWLSSPNGNIGCSLSNHCEAALHRHVCHVQVKASLPVHLIWVGENRRLFERARFFSGHCSLQQHIAMASDIRSKRLGRRTGIVKATPNVGCRCLLLRQGVMAMFQWDDGGSLHQWSHASGDTCS